MVLVFVFQIAAAVAGFTLISRSRNMVSSQLETMMNSYSHNYYYYYNDDYQQGYRLNVDWIQSKVGCCFISELLVFKQSAEIYSKSSNAAVSTDQLIGKNSINFRHLISM